MLNTEMIEGYDRICRSIERILEAYNVPKTVIYRAMGWSKTTYYRRVKEAKFTPDELRKINKAIKNYRRPKAL